jgi:hypothetical protein
MIGVSVKVEDKFADVKKAADRATFENLGHAAAVIRKDAIATVTRSRRASAPGEPVHTRRGLARRAILYAMDGPYTAVVGPVASVIGQAMAVHEFGGRRGKGTYPKRPTMGPALDRNLDRFASQWRGTIGPG